MRKKLFISCPAYGRTAENVVKTIEKLHKIAEIVFEQKLDVIESLMVEELDREMTTEDIVRHVYGVGQADYFIGVDDISGRPWFNICETEKRIAENRGIPVICLKAKYIAPDIYETRKIV